MRSIPFLVAALTLGPIAAAPPAPPQTNLERLAHDFAKVQIERSFRALNRPFEPLKIIDNIYYVGASDVTSFLITSPEGHILIDSGFAATVPMIRDNVRKLGFKIEDVKVLLNSHAHIDHAGGHALFKRLTGARIVMSAADAVLLERGGRGDVLPVGDDVVGYEPIKADQIVHDGDRVTLGGISLTAHLTPGHTRGSTTWTTTALDAGTGKRLNVVFHSSTTQLPGVRLVGNAAYPAIADDYARSFRTLKALPCDVFLAPHGVMFKLGEKAARARSRAGTSANPFIDPEGYRAFVTLSEQAFLAKLRQAEVNPARPTRTTSRRRTPTAIPRGQGAKA